MPGPARIEKTGSVSTRTPRKFINTVECPRQLPVMASSLHSAGVGRCVGAAGFPRPSKIIRRRKVMRPMMVDARGLAPQREQLRERSSLRLQVANSAVEFRATLATRTPRNVRSNPTRTTELRTDTLTCSPADRDHEHSSPAQQPPVSVQTLGPLRTKPPVDSRVRSRWQNLPAPPAESGWS